MFSLSGQSSRTGWRCYPTGYGRVIQLCHPLYPTFPLGNFFSFLPNFSFLFFSSSLNFKWCVTTGIEADYDGCHTMIRQGTFAKVGKLLQWINFPKRREMCNAVFWKMTKLLWKLRFGPQFKGIKPKKSLQNKLWMMAESSENATGST